MEIFRFHPKVGTPIKDWKDALITTKMEALAKLIARECYEEQKKAGGDNYRFKVSGIYDKASGDQHGTVTIEWKMEGGNN